jgi:hypothetical protein
MPHLVRGQMMRQPNSPHFFDWATGAPTGDWAGDIMAGAFVGPLVGGLVGDFVAGSAHTLAVFGVPLAPSGPPYSVTDTQYSDARRGLEKNDGTLVTFRKLSDTPV